MCGINARNLSNELIDEYSKEEIEEETAKVQEDKSSLD